MSTKVAEIRRILAPDAPSAFVSQLWEKFNMERQTKINEQLELRNYIFATDTSTTSNSALPWKNSTTTPKLCQIRDNLHSNYISALFPNDNWLKWEAYSKDDAVHQKASTVEAYMENKCRESHFRTEISKLIYDYIDWGNAFCTVSYETNYKQLPDGTVVPNYVGPRLLRISPFDIVFNPLAPSFDKTFKIVRSVKTLGELYKLAQDEPENFFWKKALDSREELKAKIGGYRWEDFQKALSYQVDGFGNMYEYFMGQYMEILEFYGDYYDSETNELKTNRLMTVVDRRTLVRDDTIPTWIGGAPIFHVGWRFRPDNLWSMGPLDNLVGMQYRIDHLENAKADAFDLLIQPPLKITGDVEQFTWGPSSEIRLGEGGDVQPLSEGMNAIITATNQIQELENKMELYAGAPREAMGIRTPGEKTAFEVQTLDNAAGRIFQEKITNFEVELMEPALNAMLETSRRNMNGAEVIRVLDTEYGVAEFRNITRADIAANGIIRPVGARHFAKQAQDLQNLVGVMNSPVGQLIMPHTSGLALAKFVNDLVGLKGYNIFSPNIAIEEQHATQSLMQQSQEDLQVQQGTQLPPGA